MIPAPPRGRSEREREHEGTSRCRRPYSRSIKGATWMLTARLHDVLWQSLDNPGIWRCVPEGSARPFTSDLVNRINLVRAWNVRYMYVLYIWNKQVKEALGRLPIYALYCTVVQYITVIVKRLSSFAKHKILYFILVTLRRDGSIFSQRAFSSSSPEERYA